MENPNNTEIVNTLEERDKKLVWHPFTQHKISGDPIPIARASGSYIYDVSGKAYLDLVSSWWVNTYGHCHPEIAEAIYKQATTIDHVLFGGLTHEPAVKLCESLTEILPPQLKRFFFSDNGSTAVEVALKMAYQYWISTEKKERPTVLSFLGGYHGDTVGAMAVGRGCGFFEPYANLLFNTHQIPFPATWSGDPDVEEKEAHALSVLKDYLNEKGDTVCAIFMEPLVQGLSGMRMCRVQFQEQVIRLVREYSILVIFDEVMTGFGHTGTNFALDQFNESCRPDILCLAKGLTAGFLSLSLTVATEKVYEAYLGDDLSSAFLHGHTFTANPICCAAAVKSVEILQRVKTTESIAAIHAAHLVGLKDLEKMLGNKILQMRTLGVISAFEISAKCNSVANAVWDKRFHKEGLNMYIFGNSTVYMIPPYSITTEEILEAYRTIAKVIEEYT